MGVAIEGEGMGFVVVEDEGIDEIEWRLLAPIFFTASGVIASLSTLTNIIIKSLIIIYSFNFLWCECGGVKNQNADRIFLFITEASYVVDPQ